MWSSVIDLIVLSPKRQEQKERRMKEWICRELSTSTSDNENGVLMMEKELIRCKDCKHWLPHTQFGYDSDYEEYHNYCNRHLPDDDFYAFIKEAEDYCSWAERKEK